MYEKEVWDAYINSFKNKLYGLLCEYEKKGEWEKFLDSLLIELALQSPNPKSIIS